MYLIFQNFVKSLTNCSITGQSHATESSKNTLDPKWNVYYDLLLSSEDAINISVWNDKKIHSKKDGGLIKLNNAGAFLGCVKLLSNAIQRLKDTGKQVKRIIK